MTALQIQHHLVSKLLEFHTLKLKQKKFQPRSCRHKALSCWPLGFTIEKDFQAKPVNLPRCTAPWRRVLNPSGVEYAKQSPQGSGASSDVVRLTAVSSGAVSCLILCCAAVSNATGRWAVVSSAAVSSAALKSTAVTRAVSFAIVSCAAVKWSVVICYAVSSVAANSTDVRRAIVSCAILGSAAVSSAAVSSAPVR